MPGRPCPVSYTHLMGEEAQFRNAAWGGFNKEDVLRYIEMMKQSALETNMKPVSYTHLDVYKRQTISSTFTPR